MARGRRRKNRREPVAGWIWLLGGFSLGLIAALGIYLSQRVPAPGIDFRPDSRPAARAAETAPTAPATQPAAASVRTPEPPAPAPAVAAAQDEATRFDFYDVLPEFEVVVPDSGQDFRANPRATAEARSGNYIVQAGAFQTVEDADRMQARIALLGFESQIQRVAIDDAVFHRVRIGPVGDLAELNRIRRRLRDERIDYLLIDTPE